eukprot:m.242154 g.242154  ORF g.242154 m.242154 type:complete len:274 (+) comp25296_c0_seq1:14-835(+)
MVLHGQRALLTGAGKGLGRAMAHALAVQGVYVIVTDRNQPLVDKVVSEIREKGGKAEGYALDTTDLAKVKQVYEAVIAGGGLDILINNAGVVFGGPITEVSLADHHRQIAVNVGGTVTMVRTFLAHLISRKEAYILNVSSASAFLPLPYAATYSATKWGVLGFSESLREEMRLLGHSHVNVCCLCPSYINTGLFEGAQPATLTWMLTPEGVADAAIRAIRDRETVVILPWTADVLISGLSWLPRPLFYRLCSLLGVTTSMTGWKGHAAVKAKL